MNRTIVRVMRIATTGIVFIGLFFVGWLITLVATSVHDNRRIHELELRIERLEHRAEAP